MPIGLNFQRKHPRLGYRVKYLYYSFARRDILQKKISFGQKNQDKTVYIVKPDYQDGVEGLLSLLYYTGDILLVGINYDKKSKEHQCLIEKYVKGENRGTGVV